MFNRRGNQTYFLMRRGQQRTMKKIVTIISGLATMFLAVVLIYNLWMIQRDIDGWKTRAQVSSEPNDMLTYMTNVKEGMERWGMTQGYSGLIFQTPDNDMGLIFRAVNQHVDQALILTQMDRSSPEYQTGLDNLRGSIRELELYSHEYWAKHQGIVLLVLVIAGVIAFCTAGCWWLLDDF